VTSANIIVPGGQQINKRDKEGSFSMAQVDVVVFGTAASSSGCACCATACGDSDRSMERAQQIAADLTLPDAETNLADQAQVKVPVELEIVKANQQQVDRGSSPWQLDPLQVAFTFVNLQVSPEGITGEPEIQAESFKLITNNGVDAEVEVTDGPTEKVYLKRLVRQDETGIWTVVGYNPR
jgi:hypothetical protein